MERKAFRFGVLILLGSLLLPEWSLAGGPFTLKPGVPVESEARRHRNEERGFARALGFLREVLEGWADREIGSDERPTKSDNRGGIDPNGNS